MVEQLELPERKVKFIAEIIDLLLVNLVPNWEPCVPVDHLVTPNDVVHKKETEIPKHGESLIGSYQNVCEVACNSAYLALPTSSSFEGSAQSTLETSYFKVDLVVSHANLSLHGLAAVDDRCSEMSYSSAISHECSDKNCSRDSYWTTELGFVDDNGNASYTQVRDSLSELEMVDSLDYKSKVMDMESRHSVTLSSYPSQVSSSSNQDEDEDLRTELEIIEQQYQNAVKEISKRRDEAIIETRRKLSQKKIESVY